VQVSVEALLVRADRLLLRTDGQADWTCHFHRRLKVILAGAVVLQILKILLVVLFEFLVEVQKLLVHHLRALSGVECIFRW
jgi:hypothetical protein